MAKTKIFTVPFVDSNGNPMRAVYEWDGVGTTSFTLKEVVSDQFDPQAFVNALIDNENGKAAAQSVAFHLMAVKLFAVQIGGVWVPVGDIAANLYTIADTNSTPGEALDAVIGLGVDGLFISVGAEGKFASGISERVGQTLTQKSVDALLRDLRAHYVAEVKALKGVGEQMLASGMGEEETARKLFAMRRELGVKYKELTPQPARIRVFLRNMELYDGDALGPSIELLRARGKNWRQIIDSASSPGGKDLGL